MSHGGVYNYLKYALFIFLFSLTVFSSSVVLTFAAFNGTVGNNFTVEYTAPKDPAILVDGEAFCTALKSPSGDSVYDSDSSVKSITFDYFGSEYNDVINNASVVTDVATSDSVGDALMYHVGDSSGDYDVYVLSEGAIFANIDCKYMFHYCDVLSSLDFSNFNTANVTNMYSMFSSCSVLSTLDLSGWDTSSVTNMCAMFRYCNGLTTLDLSGWDTSNVTNMSSMFHICSVLSTLDLSGWDTSSVTDMSAMFYECSGLTSITVSSSKWNTAKVSGGSNMFSGCTSLPNYNSSYATHEYCSRYMTYV